MSMKLFRYILLALALPFCASAAWREGFHSANTLHLIGEGKINGDMPEVQGSAMAREAAVMDAMSHWPKYCGEADATEFRVENQKRRKFECSAGTCRARIVIEKTNLRSKCRG